MYYPTRFCSTGVLGNPIPNPDELLDIPHPLTKLISHQPLLACSVPIATVSSSQHERRKSIAAHDAVSAPRTRLGWPAGTNVPRRDWRGSQWASRGVSSAIVFTNSMGHPRSIVQKSVEKNVQQKPKPKHPCKNWRFYGRWITKLENPTQNGGDHPSNMAWTIYEEALAASWQPL